jgi:hypothetical protein
MVAMSRPGYFVTHVDVADTQRVLLTFEDGTTGAVDLSDLIARGGVFAPLREPSYFRQVRVDPEGGTIIWPNDADVAPELLYARAHEHAGQSRASRSA